MTLAWDPSTDPLVAGYNIYYGGASGAYTNEVSAGTATNVTLNGLVPGDTYYFAATTYNIAGLESSLSSEISYLVPSISPTTNQPPTLNALGDLTANENPGLLTVTLSGITSGAASENQTLMVTAISSNTGLVPNPTVNYLSANTSGSLTFTPVTNAFGTATITVVVKDNGGTANGGVDSVTNTFVVTLNPVNNQPTLNAIGNLAINENAGLRTVNLSGITSGAANENQTLTVAAVSDNTGLIPNPTVNYTNANTTGNLTFTPAANGNGTATITVTVNDGGTSNNIVTRSFTVTVSAVNNQPTLNAISNLTTNENPGLLTVTLSGITSGAADEGQTLTVTAISSNTGLVPNPTVNYLSADTSGSLTFTPVTNAYGTAAITVTVDDGGASNNIITRTFTVTINADSAGGGTNSSPTLDPIGDLVLTNGAASQTVRLTGISSGMGNGNQKLLVTASIDDPLHLISRPRVRYISPATNGALIISPRNWGGTATVMVTVNNGAASNNIITRTFKVSMPPISKHKNSTPATSAAIGVAATLTPAAHAKGQYALTVAGATGHQYVVEASSDLIHWDPVQTNTAPFTCVDPDASKFPQRFYRSVYLR